MTQYPYRRCVLQQAKTFLLTRIPNIIISDPSYIMTRSGIGSIYTWLVMLIRICGDLHISWGQSGRNGRFNCSGSDTTNSDKLLHHLIRLPEWTPSSSLRTPHIRDLNNGNPASSKNLPGLTLFSSFPSHPLPTKPSTRVRATRRKLRSEFLVRLSHIDLR